MSPCRSINLDTTTQQSWAIFKKIKNAEKCAFSIGAKWKLWILSFHRYPMSSCGSVVGLDTTTQQSWAIFRKNQKCWIMLTFSQALKTFLLAFFSKNAMIQRQIKIFFSLTCGWSVIHITLWSHWDWQFKVTSVGNLIHWFGLEKVWTKNSDKADSGFERHLSAACGKQRKTTVGEREGIISTPSSWPALLIARY